VVDEMNEYGGGPTDVAGAASEYVSLVLIIASFLLMVYMAYRVRTLRSLQFDMLVFVTILLAGEVPHILGTLGLLDVNSFLTVGLLLHTVSMIVLAVFVALRVRRFFIKGG
jgi:hypothetical protein